MPPFAGATLGFDAVAVDSSGGHTMNTVLGFCHQRLSRHFEAIKGASGQRPFRLSKPGSPNA